MGVQIEVWYHIVPCYFCSGTEVGIVRYISTTTAQSLFATGTSSNQDIHFWQLLQDFLAGDVKRKERDRMLRRGQNDQEVFFLEQFRMGSMVSLEMPQTYCEC